jgi:hypothetical protein
MQRPFTHDYAVSVTHRASLAEARARRAAK